MLNMLLPEPSCWCPGSSWATPTWVASSTSRGVDLPPSASIGIGSSTWWSGPGPSCHSNSWSSRGSARSSVGSCLTCSLRRWLPKPGFRTLWPPTPGERVGLVTTTILFCLLFHNWECSRTRRGDIWHCYCFSVVPEMTYKAKVEGRPRKRNESWNVISVPIRGKSDIISGRKLSQWPYLVKEGLLEYGQKDGEEFVAEYGCEYV